MKPNKHTDPVRFPKLISPIEQEMEKMGKIEIKKIPITVTKILVK